MGDPSLKLRRIVPAAACTAVAVLILPVTYTRVAARAAGVVELCRLELKAGNAFTRVGPPPRPAQSGRALTASGAPLLNITYEGFTSEAQAAFAYAASIIEAHFRGRIQFKVRARMEQLQSAGILGFASTSLLQPGNWTPAEGGVPPPIFEAFYLVPLADHLQGKDNTSDMFPYQFTVTLNSHPGGDPAKWYLGTDGLPPANKSDLVSVALHEMVHALGFAGHAEAFTAASETCPSPPCGRVLLPNTATATSPGFSNVFEYFTKTVGGVSLRDATAFPHMSQALGNQLLQAYNPASPRSNGVYFDGPFTTHGNGGLSARLYTPSSFNPGISYAHVDEDTYPAGDVNSLMSPFLSSAEAVHAIGPVALGVLADIGWDTDICATRLGSLTQTVPRAGGTLSLRITLPSFCNWSAVTSAAFLAVSGVSSGTGPGTLNLTIAANPGTARSGVVTINGVPYSVSQGNADVAAAIHASPAGATVTSGQSAVFIVVAGGDPSPSVRWQRSTDGGTTFADLAESSTFTGVATAELTVHATAPAMDGNRFRAVAINGVGVEAASAAVTLSVRYSPIMTTQPVDRFVDVGTTTTLSVAASGNPSAFTYAWQRSADGGVTWVDVVDGPANHFPTAPTLGITATSAQNGSRFRCRITNAVGTTISTVAVLTVRSYVTLTPSPLRFAGTMPQVAAPLTTATGPQTFRVRFDAAPGAWTAVSDEPWLIVTGGSGTGNGLVTLSIAPGATLPLGRNHAAVTFTSSMATNSGLAVAVTLDTLVASQPAFGSFDTPAGDGTVLAGSIAVTGWTLDDVGVKRVELWRDLQPGETTPPFASTPGDPRHGKVFIANAIFTEGARPDVEGLYQSTPLANRAGWGYLLLTWGLWNQGNGTYTLHAFAFDQEDKVSTIGSKTIVVNNSAAAKPFGSIDTPVIGGDPGTFPNFGWGLTPKVNGAATCKIPSNGVQVSIDSGPLQPVVYGDGRPDIAGAFPGFSNSSAAGGHFSFDWSTLANGPHTIGWYVVDDCNRADGVGSRFFNVTTGTALRAALEVGGWRSESRRHELRESDAPITVARGYGELPLVVDPGLAGSRTIELTPEERIEVRVPRGFTEALQLGPDGQGRALPAGSTWDREGGIWYWQPAPGFFGRYRIVFTNGQARINIRVIVTP